MNAMPDKFKGVRFLPALIGVAAACIVFAVALIIYGNVSGSAATAGQGRDQQTGEMLALSQAIPLQATSALAGEPMAFAALAESRARFEALVPGLAAGMQDTGAVLLQQASTVIAAEDATTRTRAAARAVSTLMPRLLEGLGNVAGTLRAADVARLTPQLERFEVTGLRIDQDLTALSTGVGDVAMLALRLSDGLDYLSQVLSELRGVDSGLGLPQITTPEGQQGLVTVDDLFGQLNEQVRAAIGTAESLGAAHEASQGMRAGSATLYASLRDAAGTSAVSTGMPAWMAWTPAVLLVIAVLALVGVAIVYKSIADISETAALQDQQNERSQQAILRLLDELSNLADGDLTVQATVSEDITGAIADSINYAIEALRELVTTINGTAISLDAAARQSQATASHLAKASVAQSKQIASASESVAAMAASVEEVSGNAERSADVARHSVDIAHKGGDAVRRTIDGMNAIRETIQETSKRIKRLGESSQEIGNIVELINDLAEQTNILALNASIQASMAGEAGRGFAVVADEVQRLAERAANATKQIDVLVRTIQADTNEAVVSMERSTTDVVGGALLAENAGAALEEIEQVSNQIASLVQNISASARQQAGASQNIARNMQVLREISSQTAENTAAASNSIGKLAELSTQLRKSVAGFRLPEGILRGAPGTRDIESSAARPALEEARKVSGLSL
jgi:twitching motility protein PilJ